MDFRRVARAAGWTLGAGVALVVGFYLVLVVVNWRDEAPSAQALELQRVIDQRPAVADPANAYVLLLGLSVPEADDPLAWGVKRKAFVETFPPADVASTWATLPGPESDFLERRAPTTKTLIETCRQGSRDCRELLQRNADAIDQWLASEGWLLDRYAKLIALTQWRETIPTDMRAPFPAYQHALNGQWLLLMTAWQHAVNGEAAAARDLLQKDQVFWRMVSRSSDTLISKMIATVAIERNFLIGNLVLRELQVRGEDSTPPVVWRLPFSREDWSMKRTFAGEWHFMRAALNAPGEALAEQKPSFVTRATDRLGRPLLRKQATQNVHAANLVNISEVLDVGISDLPRAMKALRVPTREWMPDFYNPIGIMLIRVGKDAYAPYPPRVSDLEGVRRAVLLASELRPDVCACTAEMEKRIDASTLKNPYSDDAFAWDNESRGIVFTGLAEAPRGRYMVPL